MTDHADRSIASRAIAPPNQRRGLCPLTRINAKTAVHLCGSAREIQSLPTFT